MRFWHTTPLHYVPHILSTGALYSQDRLAALGLPIRPRRTAFRRDRKLRLTGFIHLSLTPITPLLADKRARGFPHALFEFDGVIADLPGTAFLRYNAKAWRHRADFAPITDPGAKAGFLAEWRGGRYPSAELLIPDTLLLGPHFVALHAADASEADWLGEMAEWLGVASAPQIAESPHLFPPGIAPDLAVLHDYADACRAAGNVVPPPDVPFD